MGGTVYVGVGSRKGKPKGLVDPKAVEKEILAALDERMMPPLQVKTEIVETEGAKVLAIHVPKGTDRPYCLDDSKFYVRDESETSLAVRDEIVALIRQVLEEEGDGPKEGAGQSGSRSTSSSSSSRRRRSRSRRGGGAATGRASDDDSPNNGGAPSESSADDAGDAFYLPQIGVEIVDRKSVMAIPITASATCATTR